MMDKTAESNALTEAGECILNWLTAFDNDDGTIGQLMTAREAHVAWAWVFELLVDAEDFCSDEFLEQVESFDVSTMSGIVGLADYLLDQIVFEDTLQQQAFNDAIARIKNAVVVLAQFQKNTALDKEEAFVAVARRSLQSPS